MLRRNKKENTRTIFRHSSHAVHKKIIEMLEQQTNENLPQNCEDLQKLDDEAIYQVTNRIFCTVYAEIFANVPFSSHPILVSLQEENGIDMGAHHFDRFSAICIASFISKAMHQELLSYLMSDARRPVSVIVDGASDHMRHHYLVVLIQTLEHNRAMNYFYRLIPIGSDESAEGLYRAIIDAWFDEG